MGLRKNLGIKPDGQLINSPKFEKLKRINSLIDINTVEKVVAINSAIQHLTNKRVREDDCFLIYDLNEETIYWEIRSRKGFRNIVEQTVRIDAQTAVHIRTDESKYQRGFLPGLW